MADDRTCGKGLAEHSAVPAKIADLIAALGENLELHRKTLELSDEKSRREHDVYQALATAYAEIASRLAETARRMAGHRDLPVGRHDPDRLAAAPVRQAFVRYVAREQELLALLEEHLERDQSLLAELTPAGRA
jgi:hypothetical protein